MSTSAIRKTNVFENATWFALGSAAVSTSQAVDGWWLNSGTAVLRTALVLGVLGLFAGIRGPGQPWVRATALWTGAIVGSAVILFWIGPGDIWPIVLAVGGGVSAAAVFGGALLGSFVGVRRQPPDRARNAR